MNIRSFQNFILKSDKTKKMPVIFVGHGSPTNAIEKNEFTTAWDKVGKKLPKPKAILCISAHWFVDGTYVHGTSEPKTIHDYYGFPPELYNITYPAPGAPEAAKDVQKMVKSTKVLWDIEWGMDHGCWVVLKHLFPKADVPIFQMSIDFTKPPAFHFELGKELAKMRERGVLVVGSGNIVHNLGLITFDERAKPFDWAVEFDEKVKNLITNGNFSPLIQHQKLGSAAHLSIPTPDHYWPMLYTLGLIEPGEKIEFFAEGIAYQSISMRSFIVGL